MLNCKIRLIALTTAVVLSTLPSVRAETWHLGEDLDWKAVSDQDKDKFLLAVAQAKKLVNSGQTKAARVAFDRLKSDFPEIAGPDMDAFIDAEMLYCKGEFIKAANSYDKLTTTYPQSKFRMAALDRQFAIATAFLAGQNKKTLGLFKVTAFAEGLKIMKRLSERASDTPIGIEATIVLGQKYEEKGQFNKAYRLYEKLLSEHPDTEFRDQVLDREYAIATAFLRGQKMQFLRFVKMKGYAQGIKIMEKITDRAGLDTPIGLKAAVAVAEHYEKRRKFNDAYLKWWEISLQWPSGKTGRNALLGMAQSKHAAYNNYPEHKRPFYNASHLNTAKSCYEKFKLIYTKDAEELDVDNILEGIDEQLAEKQLTIAKYYHRTGSMQSANLYLNMVISDWPNTKAAETAKEMLAEN